MDVRREAMTAAGPIRGLSLPGTTGEEITPISMPCFKHACFNLFHPGALNLSFLIQCTVRCLCQPKDNTAAGPAEQQILIGPLHL